MNPTVYRKGIFFNKWRAHQQLFGFGIVWQGEKYIHFNLFNLEVAIGKCIN